MWNKTLLTVEEPDVNKFLFNIDKPEDEEPWQTEWKNKLVPESGKALLQLSLFSLPIKKLKQSILFFASEEDQLVPVSTTRRMVKKYGENRRCFQRNFTGCHYFFLDPKQQQLIFNEMLLFIECAP